MYINLTKNNIFISENILGNDFIFSKPACDFNIAFLGSESFLRDIDSQGNYIKLEMQDSNDAHSEGSFGIEVSDEEVAFLLGNRILQTCLVEFYKLLRSELLDGVVKSILLLSDSRANISLLVKILESLNINVYSRQVDGYMRSASQYYDCESVLSIGRNDSIFSGVDLICSYFFLEAYRSKSGALISKYQLDNLFYNISKSASTQKILLFQSVAVALTKEKLPFVPEDMLYQNQCSNSDCENQYAVLVNLFSLSNSQKSNLLISSYVWPNPAIPFKLFFENENLRIFFLENFHHNFDWIIKNYFNFQKRDFFFIICGWHHDKGFALEDHNIFMSLNLNKDKFYFLFNAHDEMNFYRSMGFKGDLINQNAWLDFDLFRPADDVKKIYNAVYVGRHSPIKRHFLASKVDNLALVMGPHYGSASMNELPPHVYRNDRQLSPSEVNLIINQSVCGLILSEVEGACFASSEYLLTGIPVVSTKSLGGRDFWYDDYNSIVVEDDPEDIAEAVLHLMNNPRDPMVIRNSHIKLSLCMRNKLVKKIQTLFDAHNIIISADNFFNKNFNHKIIDYIEPSFDSIWP